MTAVRPLLNFFSTFFQLFQLSQNLPKNLETFYNQPFSRTLKDIKMFYPPLWHLSALGKSGFCCFYPLTPGGSISFLGLRDYISSHPTRQRYHVNKNFFCQQHAKKDFCGLPPAVDCLCEPKCFPIKAQKGKKYLCIAIRVF
jgi:hypothetical protein